MDSLIIENWKKILTFDSFLLLAFLAYEDFILRFFSANQLSLCSSTFVEEIKFLCLGLKKLISYKKSPFSQLF